MEEVWRQVQSSSGKEQVGVAVYKISECVHAYILASHSPQALCSFVQFIDTNEFHHLGYSHIATARWSHSQISSGINLILPDPFFAGWGLGMRLPQKECSMQSTCVLGG